MAGSRRCPDAGVVIEYHLDRAGEPETDRVLPGPRFAPIDPRFAQCRRTREPVRRVLVTVGGSSGARALVPRLIAAAEAAFPGARLLVAGGAPGGPRIDLLPSPSALVDVVGKVDVAFSAAGLTAYELACAGVPSIVVAIAPNQLRVVRACAESGVALALDAVGGLGAGALEAAVGSLQDPAQRAALAAAGPAVLDGQGARRAAVALEARWGFAGPDGR
jgi:UDP-2,4-diacetamido-2,4,6-trideoxy-beta-L-altropyranose hydrolase